MDEATWVSAFVEAAGGSPLSSDDRDAILELAGLAAHASERTAAPLTCWVAANAGLTPSAAVSIARSLTAEA